MEYSECLELEIINYPSAEIYIKEDNVKGKRTNKEFKFGKSFQYMSKDYENRFLIWTAENNVLTITEQSTDFELLGNQIEIKFQKSQVLSVNVFETVNDIHFLVSTSLLVMRFSLHHPNKLRHPNTDNFQYSIFYGITDLSEMKHCITPYFNANEIMAVNSIMDFSNNNIAYFNYGLSNGSIYTFVIQESIFPDVINYFEMKESSLFSKLLSGIISRQKQNDYVDVSILDMAYVELNEQIYLVSVSRDNKLKLWSLKDRYCVGTEDLLESVLLANKSDRTMSTINYNSIISSHKLKSFLSSGFKIFPYTLVVYFHISLGEKQFSNWIIVEVMNPYDKLYGKQPFQIVNSINNAGENLSLFDFEINYNIDKQDIIGIWSLVCDPRFNGNGLFSMNWISLFESGDTEPYSCRIYNESNELYVHKENHEDPQEAVINKIFTPGLLIRSAVVNVINKIYENNDKEQISVKASIDELKQNLVLIIESSVEQELLSNKDFDCDVIELNHKLWLNLLKEIVEEHYRLMYPLGIISVAGTVGLCRYGSISLMRLPNELERIMSTTSITDSLHTYYDQNSIVSGSTLLRYLRDFSRNIQSNEAWPSIEFQLFRLGKRPHDATKRLLSSQINIPSIISSRLENHPEIIENTVTLLENLDFENGQDNDNSNMELCRMSSFSIGMLHYSTCQIIHDRICLSIALMTLVEPRILNSSNPEHVEGLVLRLEKLIKSLVSINWLLNIRQKSSPELNDVHKWQLESLNFLENRFPDLIGTDVLCLRVLQSVQNKVKVAYNHVSNWQSRMKEEMSMIVNCLHPYSEMFSIYQICKYFLSYNMPLELIEYLKFLIDSEPQGWWEKDRCFVNIVIALCYLLLNKPWKVVDYITNTIYDKEIGSSLLPSIIFNEDFCYNIVSLPGLQANLLLKFIDIIENVSNPEPYLITLAEFGNKIIQESPKDKELDTCKSIFMTIQFKNYLEIKRFEDARLAIVNNPDYEKQKNCLRQFIIALSDSNFLEALVNFEYGNLSEEFVNIIHSRALASDINILKDPFYNILYSFHIKNKDYKAASTCMLELALRLDIEIRNQGIYMSNSAAIEYLQMQAKAYLTCIMVLTLLPSEEHLFVFPTALATSFTNEEIIKYPQANKNVYSNKDDNEMDISHDSVESDEGTDRIIINLNQIRCQYNLIKCRLKVLRDSPDNGFIQSGKLAKSLTLTSLLQLGLYWDAIKLCNDFNMSLETVVTTIATRCAQVCKNCLNRPMMKEKENIVDSLEEINTQTDFASLGSLQKLLWKFLEEVLNKYDKSPSGTLCIKACSKLLNGGIELLPAWLINIVVEKKEASGALLRLYITNGFLEPAVNLASRMLDSQIDNLCLLKESYFGSVQKKQLSWISYPVIFNLFDILENMVKHKLPRSKEFHEALDEKMKFMFHILKQNPVVVAIE